jgi:hypothetical protein
MHTKLWLENGYRRDHFEDLGTDRRIILKWLLKIQSVNCIHLAQDKDQCWAPVNTQLSYYLLLRKDSIPWS